MIFFMRKRGNDLNRSERRRNNKPLTEKVYTFKQSELDKFKHDIVSEATNLAFLALLSMPLMALRDTFGFGQKRLNVFLGKLIDITKAFNEKYITLADLEQCLLDECNVRFDVADGTLRYLKKELEK